MEDASKEETSQGRPVKVLLLQYSIYQKILCHSIMVAKLQAISTNTSSATHLPKTIMSQISLLTKEMQFYKHLL